MVKFTIGIPAYKGEFFQACLASVLAQTYSAYEVIILNDKSPYDIKSIVDHFQSSRIRYYENDVNVGGVNLVDNWNKILELARGEFITIMGDDDLLDAKYLSTFNEMTEKYSHVNVFHCRSKVINEHDEVIRLTPSWPEHEYVYDAIWHRLNEYREQYISDFLYRVSSLRKVGGFFKLPLAWGSDDISFFQAAKSHGVVHTNKPVFSYRRNMYSISSSGNVFEKMRSNLMYMDWLRGFLADKPIDEDQLYTFKDLKCNLSRFDHKRKVYVLTMSMAVRPLYFFKEWIKQRKRFGLSLNQVILGLFNAYKMRKAAKQFNK
uniref:Glycosyl transferase family 2 n=1 Tax=Sphingobacterium sp. (strain 21) TaxID=743722 RepID=F4C888_SPHS2